MHTNTELQQSKIKTIQYEKNDFADIINCIFLYSM
jgi:hypothetical protein